MKEDKKNSSILVLEVVNKGQVALETYGPDEILEPRGEVELNFQGSMSYIHLCLSCQLKVIKTLCHRCKYM